MDKMYVLFIYMKKLFDSLNHKILVDKLLEKGLGAIYVNLLLYLIFRSD
jgi:hypothetical protein